jgi:hypothetical protein
MYCKETGEMWKFHINPHSFENTAQRKISVPTKKEVAGE